LASGGTKMTLLSIQNLSVAFSGLQAIGDVSFDVDRGEIVGLIGPNGAGKSTLMNCLSGVCTPQVGRVLFDGHNVLDVSIDRIVRLGIARTFQNIELFGQSTAAENVLIGCMWKYRPGLLAEILGLPQARAAYSRAAADVETILKTLKLDPIRDSRVSELAFGTQKMIELARALAAQPRLLLLDEPAAGLNSRESHQLGDFLRQLRDKEGMAVLLVEHDMPLVMKICDRIVVLDHGEVICQGSPAEVRQNTQVIASYLGDEVLDA
jgi:branched-chain amino acid transport system ATP-binding protein